jgi:hypothetical protein
VRLPITAPARSSRRRQMGPRSTEHQPWMTIAAPSPFSVELMLPPPCPWGRASSPLGLSSILSAVPVGVDKGVEVFKQFRRYASGFRGSGHHVSRRSPPPDGVQAALRVRHQGGIPSAVLAGGFRRVLPGCGKHTVRQQRSLPAATSTISNFLHLTWPGWDAAHPDTHGGRS